MAISHYIAFSALALHEDAQHRARLSERGAYLEFFVQEVRRFFLSRPFSARSCAVSWNGRDTAFPPMRWCCSTSTASITTPASGRNLACSGCSASPVGTEVLSIFSPKAAAQRRQNG